MSRFVIGQGPLLVLMHGVGLDHTMWQPLAERLRANYTILAYDLLGHGEAETLDDPATLQQFTKQLWKEVDQLTSAGPFSLCGFSMGAMIAQQAAHEYPNRITNLILMSGVHRRSQAQREGIAERFRQAKEQGPTSNIDDALARWFTPPFHASHPEEIARVRTRLHNNNPEEYLKAYQMFATADDTLSNRATAIKCRTLVTTGELDTGSTPAMMTALADEIPNGQARQLDGLAHMAPVEDPDAVADVLTTFLAEN